ncbi:MAG: hypothetical protein M5R41_17865 [Bacteroidia bacterium]|nr:hypothetical protein [Bacteroidia bacterium]
MQRLLQLPLFRKEGTQYAFVVVLTVIILTGMGETLLSSPAHFAGLLVAAAAAVLAIANYRLALLLFTAFLFAYEEFNLVSQEAFVEENISNTVLAVKVLGFALMDVLSLLLLIPVLLREWRWSVAHGRVRILRADTWLLPLILVWVFGMMTGWFSMMSFSAYTWDLRMLGHVLVFYYIYSRTFTERRDYTAAIVLGAVVFVLKQSVFLWRYVAGTGLDMGGIRRVLLGSDLPLTAVFLCLSVAAYFIYRHETGWKRPAALAFSIYFTVMLIAGLGKLTYLQATYSLLMIFLLHRGEISMKSVGKVVLTAGAASLLVYMVLLPPGVRETVSYALSSAFNWVDALKLYGDLSFGTRLLEIINVWAVLQRESAVLWGLGWGAPWSEIAVHMPFDGGAFAVEEQYSGVHVQTHIDAITIMLKVGIFGALIIYATMLRFWTASLRQYRRIESPAERWTLMALLLLLVIVIPNFLYFIRLKYLLGFALAGAAAFSINHGATHAGQTHNTGNAHTDDAE